MVDCHNGNRGKCIQLAEISKEACNGGDAGGCFNLGLSYAKGQGVRQDYKKAKSFLKKPARVV